MEDAYSPNMENTGERSVAAECGGGDGGESASSSSTMNSGATSHQVWLHGMMMGERVESSRICKIITRGLKAVGKCRVWPIHHR